ncbi:MAG: outer membrane protein assembly factor BamD [Pseudomonadota bacterium]
MIARHALLTTLTLLAALLAGCASAPEKEKTEQEIYREAKKSLERGNFQTAQTQLQELETRFPFGRFSEQAQFDMMYAQMRGLDYPGAVATATRFLRQNPGHANADYALYLKGLANYWMQSGVLERRSPTNKALRDLGALRDAYTDFATLLARYPQSDFAADARARMLYLRNQLAEQELASGWYYVRRGACIAAIKRAHYVLENYPSSPGLADALAISSECHRRLGETATADRMLSVLKLNFPDYARLDADGALDIPEGRSNSHSWLATISFGLLGD